MTCTSILVEFPRSLKFAWSQKWSATLSESQSHLWQSTCGEAFKLTTRQLQDTDSFFHCLAALKIIPLTRKPASVIPTEDVEVSVPDVAVEVLEQIVAAGADASDSNGAVEPRCCHGDQS